MGYYTLYDIPFHNIFQSVLQFNCFIEKELQVIVWLFEGIEETPTNI